MSSSNRGSNSTTTRINNKPFPGAYLAATRKGSTPKKSTTPAAYLVATRKGSTPKKSTTPAPSLATAPATPNKSYNLRENSLKHFMNDKTPEKIEFSDVCNAVNYCYNEPEEEIKKKIEDLEIMDLEYKANFKSWPTKTLLRRIAPVLTKMLDENAPYDEKLEPKINDLLNKILDNQNAKNFFDKYIIKGEQPPLFSKIGKKDRRKILLFLFYLRKLQVEHGDSVVKIAKDNGDKESIKIKYNEVLTNKLNNIHTCECETTRNNKLSNTASGTLKHKKRKSKERKSKKLSLNNRKLIHPKPKKSKSKKPILKRRKSKKFIKRN